MIIYIEDCLIENFFVTLLLLLPTKELFKDNSKFYKLCLASLFASIVSVFYPLLYLHGFILIAFKLAIGILIVCIALSKNKITVKCFVFMLLTSMYGGLNVLIYSFIYDSYIIEDNFPTYILIIMLYAFYSITMGLIKSINNKKSILSFVYEIEITNDYKSIKDTAFLDSGNILCDNIDNSPIFIINYCLFKKLYKNISFTDLLTKDYKNLKNPHYVKSTFAGGSGKLLVFSVDLLKILTIDKKIQINKPKFAISYIKFNKNLNCNMLLNAQVFCNKWS